MKAQPDFARVLRFVGGKTGLHFPESRRESIESAIVSAMRATRSRDTESLLDRLREDCEARDDLLAEITVGETYFFRDVEQFAYIRENVAPGLRLRQEEGHAIRVWSAGCASGEEPYSLAITLREAGLDPERLYVLGTDLSRARLAVAERGRYTRWSLRGVEQPVIDRWFERRGKTFDLDPEIRAAVEFRYLNLAEDRYPSLSSGVWGMDLVVCRNVLIYFDKDTVTRVARRLVASMREDGLLLLGASDPAVSAVTDTSVELTRAGIAYRRADASADRPRDATPATLEAPAATFVPEVAPPVPIEMYPPPVPGTARAAQPSAASPTDPSAETEADAGADPVAKAYAAREYDRVATMAAEAAADGSGGPAVYVHWVRALANQGRLDEAERVCGKGLETWRHSAELAYLRSVLLLHANRPREASASARQALYIDRGSIVAHLALADARIRLGERASAGVALTNALRLLRALPEGTVVPASDGEVSHRMREMVAARLRLLRDAA